MTYSETVPASEAPEEITDRLMFLVDKVEEVLKEHGADLNEILNVSMNMYLCSSAFLEIPPHEAGYEIYKARMHMQQNAIPATIN